MFGLQRQQQILDILKTAKSVSVSSLAKQFFICEATIRRDLEKLKKMGLCKRTYGGAVFAEGLAAEIPLIVRETEQKDQKQLIGKAAAKLVRDSDIIIMDSSSTVLKMVPYLKGKSNLTIITNGAKAAIDLGEMLHTKIYCTGGRLRENSLSYIGETARICLENYFADVLFFSCRSLSIENGLMDSNEEESELRRIMIRNSRKTVLLCDSTKFNTSSFVKICGFNSIDYLVTDQKLESQWEDMLEQSGVELIYT